MQINAVVVYINTDLLCLARRKENIRST